MRYVCFFAVLGLLYGCASLPISAPLTEKERQIASRMMLSISHYCSQGVAPGEYCNQPMLKLPKPVAKMIAETDLGGVILFAPNINSIEQSLQLTDDLQRAARRQTNPLPLFIAVDQEGGRVVRLPRHLATSFSGNMAIGATHDRFGTYYAEQVGRVLGTELKSLGINVNFAPTLDVNANPDNPVINIRSFSSDPHVVAELGIAMVGAMQAEGVAAALKHFPGHGDTDVDSHSGLPCIDRPAASLIQSDLLPFQRVINEVQPALIMTAHIQYPEIDADTLPGLEGESIFRPATMSKRILTDLLREEMGYDGVIVTDALNMRGIRDYFEPVQAVVETFRAGADLALMPFSVQSPEQIEAFKDFIRRVSSALDRSEDLQQMQSALDRLQRLRSVLTIEIQPFETRLAQAHQIVGQESHRILEWQLANHAVTLVKSSTDFMPWSEDRVSQVEIIADDSVQGGLIKKALIDLWPLKNILPPKISIYRWTDLEDPEIQLNRSAARLVVLDQGYRSPVVSENQSEISTDRKIQLLENRLLNQPALMTALVAMQSPYDIQDYLDSIEVAVAAYHSVIYQQPDTSEHSGMTYQAIAALLLGLNQQSGSLPVQLNTTQGVTHGVQ